MSRVQAYNEGAPAVAVLFVKADWCGYCTKAKPEVARAAAILGSVVPVYAVDSERNAKVVESLGVDGFPTILFRDGRGRLHKYPRAARVEGRAIADWVCTKSGKCVARA